MKKNSHLARDGGSNFFFSFFKNSVLKTHFDDGTENDFFFSVKCLYEFSVDFFLFVFFFSKQKSDFFLCYREFWPLCSGVVFFFSGPVVRLLCSHNLRPSKRPQCLEKLSDFQSLWFTSFITFEKILQILRIKETYSPFWFHEFFFSSFLWLNSLKKTVRLQNNFLNYYFSTLLLFNSKFWGAICFMLQRCWLDVFRKSPRFVSKTAKTTGDFLRLPKNTSHCSKEGVGFGMLRIWNCIGWFYNIDLIKET